MRGREEGGGGRDGDDKIYFASRFTILFSRLESNICKLLKFTLQFRVKMTKCWVGNESFLRRIFVCHGDLNLILWLRMIFQLCYFIYFMVILLKLGRKEVKMTYSSVPNSSRSTPI